MYTIVFTYADPPVCPPTCTCVFVHAQYLGQHPVRAKNTSRLVEVDGHSNHLASPPMATPNKPCHLPQAGFTAQLFAFNALTVRVQHAYANANTPTVSLLSRPRSRHVWVR